MNPETSPAKEDNSASKSRRDRRCHYRVDDQLGFEFKLVEPKFLRQSKATELFSARAQQSLMDELNDLDKEGQNLLREIAAENRSVAIYLSILNRKTQLIAQHVCASSSDSQLEQINLSEGGLAFIHPSPLNIGDYLAIALRLPDDAWELFVYARIVRCLSAVPSGFHVAVAFCDTDARQEKLLTRRVLKVQMQSHRKTAAP